MAAPDVDTTWATDTIAEYVLDNDNNSQIALNKTEPDLSVKISGVRAETPLIRQFYNYWKNAVHLRLNFLQYPPVGTVIEVIDGTTNSVTIRSDRGGDWVDLGTRTVTYSNSTVTLRAFRKVSETLGGN